MISPLSDIKSKKIGKTSTIWQFVVILENAVIGENCNINSHTFIENDVVIGDRVTVKSGVYLWDGITIEDDVFIGPNVTFTNDKYPRSKQYPESFQKTLIKKGASIGAGAIILGGVTIGEKAMVAAGALVTKDVPPFTLVKGSPATIARQIEK
ncbi:MAG: acyltransferase [Algoriphagus aquaeductus]|uniref:acyltransferase n=1 Tax=Algoriphagus TaxID=246875 RepID=UPI00164EFE6A|nr:acyltransferase [Algoriphagus sp. AK58]MBC6367493.1 dTDP-6-deoxy-3,4-keto-hexulose isomerase [Algoriphagus sp. AK58]